MLKRSSKFIALLGAPILTCSASTSSKMHSEYPLYGPESIMARKAHGTCPKGVQLNLRWGCDQTLGDRITCYNRHFAENFGYWLDTDFYDYAIKQSEPITFYDSVTGKPLFNGPVGRTMSGFLKESQDHGWPSFRDEEVVWENVRCLENGETVSLDGSHLGHNLPDNRGNRYCINLVSVAGKPSE
ncbi:unnamed protein product [Oikopleura dioica]|uniref:Uncharacterized protein n=1 Tax=Oikopleura dioica TaxID=34765 RepID=E4WVI3_OIKDI|nr:unnamed protein product [Oikopleura dioica]